MDSIDKKIIGLLSKDGRISSKRLAENLDISSAAIRRRVQKLVDTGVIKIIAVPDANKIDRPTRVFLALNVKPNKIKNIVRWLVSREEVRWLYVVGGRFDIVSALWFTSSDELYRFIHNEVSELDGVVATETFLCLHAAKMRGIVLDEFDNF